MHIDSKIFLSRPNAIKVVGAANLYESLQNEIDGADKVVILSAYFGVRFLKDFFGSIPRKNRNSIALTLVFGVENSAKLPYAVDELREFRKELIKLGFKIPTIKVIDSDKKAFSCEALPHQTSHQSNLVYWFSQRIFGHRRRPARTNGST